MTDLSRQGIHMVARPLVIPRVHLPEGFSLVHLPAADVRDTWCALLPRCDLLDNVNEAQTIFDRDFAPRLSDFAERCVFLRDDGKDCLIGTATAWFPAPEWPDFGLVHWVGVLPEYRGRSLSLPILARVLSIMAQQYHQAYLSTQGFRLAAILQYLRLGFRPCYTSEASRQAWEEVATHIHHPGLLHPLAGCPPSNQRNDVP